MRAVITVIGHDNVGILNKVSGVCAKYQANVLEVTQSVLQDMFAMIMLVDISKMNDENLEANSVFQFTVCMKTFLMPCTVYKTVKIYK